MNDKKKKIIKTVITFLVIMALGYLVIFISPLLTTNYVEYMAIALVIVFHAAVTYIAITKKE